MLTEATILRVMSPYKCWLDSQLIGFEVGKDVWDYENSIAHYLVIKPDLSNLQQTLEWVWKNQPFALEICGFSRQFALKALHMNTIQAAFVAALENKPFPIVQVGGRRRKHKKSTRRHRRARKRSTRRQ
jgi:hypothetical protein